MLNTIIHASSSVATPLLMAHGLFGSARNLGVIAKRLSEDRSVTVADMRNHGSSPWYDTQSYFDMADDLAGLIEDPAHVMGHSMGGKAAMVLALRQPEKVQRLIVADIAPVTYGHTQMPLVEAMKALDLTRIETRGDADRQLADSIPEKGVRAFLLQSLDIKDKAWRLNLDVLGKEMDKIIGFPEVEGQFDGPTLFLTGADSDYVRREHRDSIKALFPKARFAALNGAGHWLHADKPREFETAIRLFLNQ